MSVFNICFLYSSVQANFIECGIHDLVKKDAIIMYINRFYANLYSPCFIKFTVF